MGKTRVFNLACGPAVEVGRFLREHEESDLTEFDLLDFNAETLEYTRERLTEARMSAGRETTAAFLPALGEPDPPRRRQGDTDEELNNYDIVYCAGLFDYLSQRVCQRLVDLFCKMAKTGRLGHRDQRGRQQSAQGMHGISDGVEPDPPQRIEEMNDLIPDGPARQAHRCEGRCHRGESVP
jgi:hypothetical protein